MRRRPPARSWTHAAIAVAMAYAFVLQVLLLSVSGGFHVAAASDARGVICLQDGASAGPDHAPAQAHDGLCCIASCHGPALAGPAPGAVLFERLAPVAVAGLVPDGPPHLRLTSDVLPVGSRAPPRLG